MAVTTIEIPMETPILIDSRLIKAIPMLIPKDTPISNIVSIHIKNRLNLFLLIGNPTQLHLISSG